MRSCTVVPPKVERPLRHTAAGTVQANFVITPSVVEAMGRSTSVSFSARTGDPIIGLDVAPPQRWVERDQMFRGFAAGLGSNGVAISYPGKKTVACREFDDFAVVITGTSAGGGISVRPTGSDQWDDGSHTTVYSGDTSDGGGSAPRATHSRKIARSGGNIWCAARRSASPTMGIARSTDSGVNWTAWSFGTSRNYQALQLSAQWNAIYGAVDGRGAAGSDGVFILTGITGAVTETRIDNAGVGNPGGLVDVRDVYCVQETGSDCLWVVVGNAAGSDAKRGIWRCRISHDPTSGFVVGTHVTWTHVFTPGASDRINCVVAFKPNGPTAGPIYVVATYFKTSTAATGTYVNSPGAGGATKTYQVTAVRSLNGDDASPSFDVISNASNVSTITKGTRHDHIIAYSGEPSNENARWGGSNFVCQDMDISADGRKIVAGCSAVPWICEDPWVVTPIWRPFGKGLGGLEAPYSSTYIPGTNHFAVVDDDRALYTFKQWGDIRVEWCAAEDVDGFSGTSQSCSNVSTSVNGNTLLLANEVTVKGYRVSNPFNYATASVAALSGTPAGTSCIGAYEWVDSTSTTRVLVVTDTHIYRDGVSVATFASAAHRTMFATAGAVCWLHVTDLGIYRSLNNGSSWTLWWDMAISDDIINRFTGHMVQDFNDPTTLWITFSTPGIWRAQNADSSTAGSGVSGSRPSDTSQISGGAVTASTSIGPLAVDAIRGDIFAAGYVKDGSARASLYVLRNNDPSSWQDIGDDEYAESCIIPVTMTCMGNGYLLIGTAGNSTLRRMT